MVLKLAHGCVRMTFVWQEETRCTPEKHVTTLWLMCIIYDNGSIISDNKQNCFKPTLANKHTKTQACKNTKKKKPRNKLKKHPIIFQHVRVLKSCSEAARGKIMWIVVIIKRSATFKLLWLTVVTIFLIKHLVSKKEM